MLLRVFKNSGSIDYLFLKDIAVPTFIIFDLNMSIGVLACTNKVKNNYCPELFFGTISA